MGGQIEPTQRRTKTCCGTKFFPASLAELFIHEEGNEVEFVTLLRFDSMDAVKEFAGADESKPVIYPKAESLLIRMDERSRHYRIAM